MRMVLMIAAGALMTSAVSAGAQPAAETGEKTPAVAVAPMADPSERVQASKVLYVCNEEEDARLIAPNVDYGFVTAKQVMAGRDWSGPKCITAREARRLSAMKQMAAK